MIQIKRFIDKVSYIESKQGKDIVLPLSEARGLRDELAKLLVDHYYESKQDKTEKVINVEIVGGKF
jgi:hypothetical protein|tara:strand:- start:990 stop:1187 length:198 start_codon:yes stop_codon:yes gene_type:complete